MFTGIISHLGKVELIRGSEFTFSTSSSFFKGFRKRGSVSVNGVCLTVIKPPKNNRFSAELMPETIKRSSFGNLKKGDLVNLELPVSVNSRFDGHIVQGHVDGVANLKFVKKQGNSRIMQFDIPRSLAKYIVEKGSISINGISLTVIDVIGNSFTVGIIPHTWGNTMLNKLNLGGKVNIEIDILAKYLEKQVLHAKKTH